MSYLQENSGGGAAAITINTTPILSGTDTHALYDNAGTVGEAANFEIISGNPNATTAYFVQGIKGLFVVPNGSGNNWFEGGAGNPGVTGPANYGTGDSSLINLTSGSSNMAVGVSSLQACMSGGHNTAIGTGALGTLVSDFGSCAIGSGAGTRQNGGGSNVFIGDSAGTNLVLGSFNTLIGTSVAVNNTMSGIQNIVIGYNTDVPSTSASGQISIGNMIYGTGCTGQGAGVSSGWIGIGVKAAYAAEALGVNGTIITNSAAFMIGSNTAYTNGAGTGSGVSFTNAPGASGATGNPTKWIPVNDAGVTRYVPAF
jgi:trimeric autotransporter adhesin